MAFKNRFMTACFCLALQTTAYANSTLTLSLVNDSIYKFVFDRAVVRDPQNTLEIDEKTLMPGETATITGTITGSSDLSGFLYFNGDARFRVEVRRQFHFGQPMFHMIANYTVSHLKSKTFNPVKGPKLLSYTAATVVLEDSL